MYYFRQGGEQPVPYRELSNALYLLIEGTIITELVRQNDEASKEARKAARALLLTY